MKLFCQGI